MADLSTNVTTGDAGHAALHNAERTAINLLNDPIVTTTVAATTYTLVLTDASKVLETTSASATAVTVPPNSNVAFEIGTVIEICQAGAGQLTITPGSGVTVRTPASLTGRVQWSTLALRKRNTNEWVLSGDLT